MGRCANAGLRTLLVMKYLLENTDENHRVTRKDITTYLEENDFFIERKTLYTDMKTLGPDAFGLDIQTDGGKYAIVSREFQTQEVKLLADMIQSSNFITQKKSAELIKKLESLVSRYDAQVLSSQIVARNRVKSSNEQMFITIDRVSEAISKNRSIHFKYFKYDMQKNKAYQHDGKTYLVSPFALIAGEDNYYMLAYSHEDKELRHYRVDRMDNVRLTKKSREGTSQFNEININQYPTMVFNMFRGKQYRAQLSFKKGLVDTVMDRFGKDIMLIPENDDWFSISVEVMESPQFFAWIAGFGDAAKIKAPAELRMNMKKHLQNILSQYE